MSETTDVLYLTRGRLEFTKATLPALLQNTDWSMVGELIIYNDATPEKDNATSTYVQEMMLESGLGALRQTNLRSPVAVMAHFLARTKAKRFAKIDNDIVVCPGWLNALSDVMDRNPELELLGMEPGRGGSYPTVGPNVRYGYNDARHIGGVGLMQTRAFTTRPPPIPDGFFGFTEWQHTYDPVKGWIAPDLRIFALDLLPFEPWRSLVKTYQRTPGLQRDWPKYEPEMNWHWDWWLK